MNLGNKFDIWIYYENITIVSQAVLTFAWMFNLVDWSLLVIFTPLIISAIIVILALAKYLIIWKIEKIKKRQRLRHSLKRSGLPTKEGHLN